MTAHGVAGFDLDPALDPVLGSRDVEDVDLGSSLDSMEQAEESSATCFITLATMQTK
eukprot:CAMPEP_0175046938 /NCGR_PEP_ID=MMETSP0052_2-20121109/5311_1 /TAXON_ID=51329 ORGANISM="Polytomella parva, Strain SAG 63-3" /NCGR_SAMPLE_ID=MMETSP0052_2 /ASSEMBLY_ACC=CAM_ASM_000194 /LENGTH=56 /DNA_ID=CAMNT_0016310745 /DNA_START=488 /DNA_END=658 /DNA_ORIENTATION=+